MCKELNSLKEKVYALDTPTFLKTEILEHDLELACVAYLNSLGYKSIKKFVSFKVNKLDELIDLFYNLLEFYHNDRCSLASNRKKDRAVLSDFITKRQEELSCSYQDSLQDCANIINALFIHEAELDLTMPIGLWVFGSVKCKWVTDKIINLLNNEREAFNIAKVSKMADEYESRLDEDLGFDYNRLEKIYG